MTLPLKAEPWPRVLDAVFGPPPAGDYRVTPEDFVVEEILDFAPEGQGEHLWLWIEKRGLTTLEVVRHLARACDVTQRAVGYSGMKDRIAVTRQWLSVHLPGREGPDDLAARLAAQGVEVLEQVRHPRKLKRGVHRATVFRWSLPGQRCKRLDWRRAGSGCAGTAHPTASVRSASARTAATWYARGRFWPAAGASGTIEKA